MATDCDCPWLGTVLGGNPAHMVSPLPRDGLRQLQGYQKPVYVAGADEKATPAALECERRRPQDKGSGRTRG